MKSEVKPNPCMQSYSVCLLKGNFTPINWNPLFTLLCIITHAINSIKQWHVKNALIFVNYAGHFVNY